MDDDTDTDTDFEDIKPMSNKEKFSWLIVFFFVLDIFLFYIYTNPMSPVCLLIAEMGILFYAARELVSFCDNEEE